MLQEEDPSGEAHLRFSGGIPVSVELKEGYYDGPYAYINEEGNYVCTDKGEKVDVHCIDLGEYVWEKRGDISRVKTDFDCFKDRKEEIIRQAESYAKAYKNFDESQKNSFFMTIIRKIHSGFSIVEQQSKRNPNFSSFWFIKDPSKFKNELKSGLKVQNSNQSLLCMGETDVVKNVGFFEPRVEGDLTFWDLKVG